MSGSLHDDCPCGCGGRIDLQICNAADGGHVQISKVQDILRQKISKRPDRQFLIEHHILKDTNVAPSLQVYEQSLKKARLADNLNDKLLKRPGPLELVEHNILETDPVLKEVIKDGLIPYEKTSSSYESLNPLSCSDDPGQLDLLRGPTGGSPDCGEYRASPLAIDQQPGAYLYNVQGSDSTQICGRAKLCNLALAPKLYDSNTDHEKFNIWQAKVDTAEAGNLPASVKKRRNGGNSVSSNGRPVGRLKSSLIFHEYRGPSQLNQSKSCSSGEYDDNSSHCGSACKRSVMDTYKVLLHQQQIFLELLHDLQMSEDVSFNGKEENCADRQMEGPDHGQAGSSVFCAAYGSQRPADRSDLTGSLDALSRLRVSDLRDKCRQRGLFVSGTKQDLIKRITRHDALQRNDPFVSSQSEVNNSVAVNMVGSNCSLLSKSYESQEVSCTWARNMIDRRLSASEIGVASGKNLSRNTAQETRRRPGLEDVSRQVKAIQDLNFAELFAAVDAASSAGRWSSGFENLFSMAQQEPTAGCYIEDRSA